jgi:hypothetical protein
MGWVHHGHRISSEDYDGVVVDLIAFANAQFTTEILDTRAASPSWGASASFAPSSCS